MVLLTIFQLLVSRYAASEKVIVGTDLANRFPPETEDLIGFFVNVVPMVADFSDHPTLDAALAWTKSCVLQAFANSDLPFDRIAETAASKSPLVQFLFVMQHPAQPLPAIPGIVLERHEIAPVGAKFDLAVFLRDLDGEISIEWLYRTDLFSASAVARFAKHFEVLLRAALAAPATPLNLLRHVGEQEEQERERSRAHGRNAKMDLLKKAKRQGEFA